MHVVLYQPEIPQNTGNIARTCVLTGTSLHLIRPLGFSLSEKHLRRAGLDYWQDLDLNLYDDSHDFFEKNDVQGYYGVTTKGTTTYTSVQYTSKQPLYFLFGRETKGLPDSLLTDERCTPIRIPMIEKGRSLNLSNCVSITLFEGLRQIGFPSLL